MWSLRNHSIRCFKLLSATFSKPDQTSYVTALLKSAHPTLVSVCTHGSLSNLSCAQCKCSSAAVFTRVSLVTLQSVHAALSLQKLQNCITASIRNTELRISPNVRSYDCVVLVIELSLRPMSRCLVNTALIAYCHPRYYYKSVCCYPLIIHWHCHSRLSN